MPNLVQLLRQMLKKGVDCRSVKQLHEICAPTADISISCAHGEEVFFLLMGKFFLFLQMLSICGIQILAWSEWLIIQSIDFGVWFSTEFKNMWFILNPQRQHLYHVTLLSHQKRLLINLKRQQRQAMMLSTLILIVAHSLRYRERWCKQGKAELHAIFIGIETDAGPAAPSFALAEDLVANEDVQ